MIRYVTSVFFLVFIFYMIIFEVVAYPDTLSTSPSTYDTKFDNIDVDAILRQERLLNHYIKCLEGKGQCTPDGKMLKETLPDAIETDCSKCSEKQKYSSDKVTRFLIDNRPQDWERLEKLYDTEGKYRKKYLAEKAEKAAAEKEATA